VVIAEESYSPYVNQAYPTNVYWGDTHLHTNLSVDAYGMGNTALGPEDAYRFAKGGVVTAHNGMNARLSRPLDFLVIADHASLMGVARLLEVGTSDLLRTKMGKLWHEKMKENPLKTGDVLRGKSLESYGEVLQSIFDFENGKRSFFWQWSSDFRNDQLKSSVWQKVISTSDRHNDPGKFTAFSGFEWTSLGQAKGNLHRVVIFKDNIEKVGKVLPFSTLDSSNPEDLWRYLQGYEQKTGGEVLAIPHNGNVSNGEMFSLQNFDGSPLSREYALTRSRWEPLYEVTQIKGDGEAHPILSPRDEFADFETWNSWAGWTYRGIKTEGWKKRKESEYARSALKLGLDQQEKLGVNPFKFGMIGSTDSHTSFAAIDENNYWGKLSLFEPSPFRLKGPGADIVETSSINLTSWEFAASGYAAVWAEENTREALFAAMKRKEVYASTGPRITVRFFGGWNYQKDDAFKPDLARIGYEKGVPMGGDLTHGPKGKSPNFLIRAVKDPDGANLDRVQVIKGWHDKNDELHEKIYNVALSGNRKENKNSKAQRVGSTVNIKDASYTNSIGDPELAVVWTDPDFDKDELAFYYVRVLEIPTPRWAAYDARFFNLKDIPEEIPMVTQERAYTSPIWYSPPAKAGGE